VAICYDVEFPEQIRALADAGAEVLCVPYCTDDANGHHRVTRCALARAVENTIYVVTAGGVGSIRNREGFAHHYAESVIATPCDVGFPADGILARALPGQAQCLVADLDLALLRKKRAAGTVLPLRDLRRDLFPTSSAAD
jgi:predicted amidohydrolase